MAEAAAQTCGAPEFGRAMRIRVCWWRIIPRVWPILLWMAADC